MGRNEVKKTKKITVLIPHTEIIITFSISENSDKSTRTCLFDNYKDAEHLMKWANNRLGDRFDFLEALEEASIAAITNDPQETKFSMNFSKQTLHRLIKKMPPSAVLRPKKPRKLKNLFGLLLKKDGYNLSEGDFSTDTSDEEHPLFDIFYDTSEMIIAEKEIAVAKKIREQMRNKTNNTFIASELSTSEKAEVATQHAIFDSLQDEEKLRIPEPRKISVQTNSNLKAPTFTMSKYIHTSSSSITEEKDNKQLKHQM